jgi:hypothetical protein
LRAVTRQCAVIVTVLNVGPQDANIDGLVVRLIFVGIITLVFIVIGPVTAGAHLNESPALPELPVPPLPENVMLRGFVDQRALGVLLDAKPTAA